MNLTVTHDTKNYFPHFNFLMNLADFVIYHVFVIFVLSKIASVLLLNYTKKLEKLTERLEMCILNSEKAIEDKCKYDVKNSLAFRIAMLEEKSKAI